MTGVAARIAEASPPQTSSASAPSATANRPTRVTVAEVSRASLQALPNVSIAAPAATLFVVRPGMPAPTDTSLPARYRDALLLARGGSGELTFGSSFGCGGGSAEISLGPAVVERLTERNPAPPEEVVAAAA